MEHPSFFENKWPVFLSNGVVLSLLLPLTCEFKSAIVKIKGAGSSFDQKHSLYFVLERAQTLDKNSEEANIYVSY